VSEQSVRVNPITCEAHGLCAELLPERIRLDDWGYPIVDPTPLTPALNKNARRAVAACPTLALLLQDATRAPHVPGAGARGRSAARSGR
jgi:ferredoxin